jgi:hypothetical protein
MQGNISAGALAGIIAGIVFGILMQMMTAPTPDGREVPMMLAACFTLYALRDLDTSVPRLPRPLGR